MSNVLMLYTSLTGNTELMAKEMLNQLNQKNEILTKVFDFESINVDELLKYDIIFIGLYTWTEGHVPFEVEGFYDDLSDLDLAGKICGVFGSADSYYDRYGTAVDMMYERLAECGATMISNKIIVDLDPTTEELEKSKKMVDTAFKMIEI